MDQDIVSFVLRFVREAGEDQQARWRGLITHVQSDAEKNFAQFGEAFTFMQEHVNGLVQTTMEGAAQANEANPFMETARLWGEYAPRYTEFMQKGMETAVQGAGAMPQQMNEMMASMLTAWGLPTQSEQNQTVDALESLTTQITGLNATIDELEAEIVRLKAAAKPKPRATSRKRSTTKTPKSKTEKE